MIIQFKDLLLKQKSAEIIEQLNMRELITSRQDIVEAGPVEVSLQANPTPDTVWISGNCTTAVEFVCSRCLCDYKQTLEIPFNEAFSEKQEIVDADEEEMTHLVTTDRVDLLPYVEETVMLGLPFIPLCNEECLGLCPMCGQNKNEQPCDCKEDKTDPRLEGLKAFFEK
jgi:uncharacterized protein